MPNLVGVSARPRFRHRFSLGRKDIKESKTIRNHKKPGYIVSVGDIKWESKCNLYWYGKRLQWTNLFLRYEISKLQQIRIFSSTSLHALCHSFHLILTSSFSLSSIKDSSVVPCLHHLKLSHLFKKTDLKKCLQFYYLRYRQIWIIPWTLKIWFKTLP